MNAKPRGRQFFNNPGPTNIPDRILRAMDRPVIDFMSDEFIAIQKQESAIPWVNTVAVGRGSAKAWYADIGAVPNVSPDQTAACTTPFGKAMAAALPNVPFFDGARSACDWQTDADSAQKGAIGPSRMPSLQRDDYVGNMNDSYWLANATAPLTG